MEKLPLSSKSVNMAISIRTFHHLKDPQLIIKEFYRILKPKGFLILTFFGPSVFVLAQKE